MIRIKVADKKWGKVGAMFSSSGDRILQAYNVRPLGAWDIDVTYVLVAAANASISESAWSQFCQVTIDARETNRATNDIIGAFDSRGIVRGLFVAECRDSLLFGTAMEVPLLVAVSAADEDGVIESLLAELRRLAARAQCRVLRIWTHGGKSWNRVTRQLENAREFNGLQIVLS